MSKLFSLATFALLIGGTLTYGTVTSGTAQAANAAGGRRYYYRSIPSDSATVRQPAARAPAAQAQSNRQTYRRYSVAPSGSMLRTSTPARMGRSAYGPNYWRADRKILGY